MDKTLSLSIVVLTQNEADNIKRCLDSISWCDDIVIIDDSTDATIVIAQRTVPKNHLRVIGSAVDTDFARLRNKGLQLAKHEWVLFLDADEAVSDALHKEMSVVLPETNRDGFYLKRRDFFLGSWLKYGETSGVMLLKLGKKSSGKWRRRVHEVWEMSGNRGLLNHPILHYPHPTVAEFVSRINRWTTLDAQEFIVIGKRVGFISIIAFPTAKFIRNYFMKLGFLDGMPGLIMAMLMSFHSFLTRAKLYQLQHKNSNGSYAVNT